jgi:hypothetical protein
LPLQPLEDDLVGALRGIVLGHLANLQSRV